MVTIYLCLKASLYSLGGQSNKKVVTIVIMCAIRKLQFKLGDEQVLRCYK